MVIHLFFFCMGFFLLFGLLFNTCCSGCSFLIFSVCICSLYISRCCKASDAPRSPASWCRRTPTRGKRETHLRFPTNPLSPRFVWSEIQGPSPGTNVRGGALFVTDSGARSFMPFRGLTECAMTGSPAISDCAYDCSPSCLCSHFSLSWCILSALFLFLPLILLLRACCCCIALLCGLFTHGHGTVMLFFPAVWVALFLFGLLVFTLFLVICVFSRLSVVC